MHDPTMTDRLVKYSITTAVATITLNRPDVLNSFNRAMSIELQDALTEAAHNQKVRAILLTGAGRGFCAGQDLAEVAPGPDGSLPELGAIVRESYNPIIKLIRETEKPVVCAVNGVAAGAGANLALCCDIIVAGDNASFVQSFSKVGLIPDSGGTFFLPRLVGLARATALTMLAEKIGAVQAFELGLVYKVFPTDQLVAEALNIAQHLAAQPTIGLGLTKRAFNASFNNSLTSQLDLEEELQAAAGKTNDYREGVKSFLEKRSPNFSGS
jgi:2-(1,2-epoxy-1,2-dihydrophenyl)acetyl-CoA isomerase